MNSASLVLAASLALLLGVSLPGKLRPINADPGPTGTAVATVLTGHGWRLEATESGLYDLASWRGPDCDGLLVSGSVPANGEAHAVMVRIAGSDGLVLYVQNGQVHRRLAQPAAYLNAKFDALWHRLGLSPNSGGGVTALAITAGCRNSAALPFRLTD